MGAALPATRLVHNPDAEAALRAAMARSFLRVLPGAKDSTQWSVTALPDRQTIVEQEFVMLTISAYDFRVIVLLHYALSAPVQQLAAEMLKTTADKLSKERALDCLNELGNGLCGELKRELANVNPHLGMSTPNRLSRNNLSYMTDLSVSAETHARVMRDGQPLLAASIYACTYGDVDFRCLLKAQTGEVEGASVLELF